MPRPGRKSSAQACCRPFRSNSAAIFEVMMGDTKRRLAEQDRQVQQAQVDENDAVTALGQEQSRWGDLNTRLDDLERTLGAR